MQNYLLTTLDSGARVITEPLPAVRETVVTLLRQRGPKREPVVFEAVPARECQKCGEQWFSMRVMRALEQVDIEGRTPSRVLSVPVFPLMELVP